MGWFSKKLIKTPDEEMFCECGLPLAPTPICRNMNYLFHYEVIKQHTFKCIKCGKENTYNG